MKPFKIGRHVRRHLPHNENPCAGRRCAECTPNTHTGTHRAEPTQEGRA